MAELHTVPRRDVRQDGPGRRPPAGAVGTMRRGLEDLDEMTPPSTPTLAGFERSHLAKTAVRAVAIVAVLVAVYYFVPIATRPHEAIGLRLGVSMAFFIAVLTNEIRLIAKHDQPMLRAAVAMATIIPLFLVLFAWIYLTMARSNPATFGGPLDRTSALYFTVSVFSTVGFGDITPKTDPARLVVTVQMLADLAVVAVVIRLILGAATRGQSRQRDVADD
ncbi:MAG: potassium channel family protein [Acidimicrobiales bacterium]